MGPLTKLGAIITTFGVALVIAAYLVRVYASQVVLWSLVSRLGLLVAVMVALGGALLVLVGGLRDRRSRLRAEQGIVREPAEELDLGLSSGPEGR